LYQFLHSVYNTQEPKKILAKKPPAEPSAVACHKLFKTNTNTMKISLAILGLAAAANAIELTPDNWDAETTGKTVLIKFLAPW